MNLHDGADHDPGGCGNWSDEDEMGERGSLLESFGENLNLIKKDYLGEA